jgi:hypothetical protein
LPIRIGFDGTTQFSFGTTTTTDIPNEPEIQNRGGQTYSWYLAPLITAAIDKNKVLVNLAQHSLNKAITLEGANKQSGYMVLEKTGFEIGVGAGAFFDPFSSVSFGFGLVPGGGSMIYAERYAPNLEAAQNLPKMKFPKDGKSLDSWKNNDVLVYTRKGGVTFYASAGAYGVSVGAGYSANGIWKVFMKKVADKKIMATVSKMQLNSFGAYVGATIASLNITLFGATDKAFAYEFDLANKSGQQGFEEFLSGNFKFTERMVKEGFVEGVTPLTEAQVHTNGRVFGVNVGIPFLGGLDFEKGMIQSFTEVSYLKNNQKIENTMSLYSRSVQTNGFISKGMRNISLFAVNHQDITSAKGQKKKSFDTANFKWLFSQEKTKIKDANDRLMDLKRKTGLWNIFEFNFPEEKKLAYSQFEFDAMISSKGTQQLMASNLDESASLMSQDQIEEFFLQPEVPENVCRVFKRINTCKIHMLKTTNKALEKMTQKLEEMKYWYQQKNWKAYTKAFAGLGEQAITNQFTFKAFMDMIGKGNFKMQFKVSGEKLKTLNLNNLENSLAFQ